MYIFFDVECRGLYGEAFSFGMVLTTDDGSVVREWEHGCNYYEAEFGVRAGKAEADPWLLEHVIPHQRQPDCNDPGHLQAVFVACLKTAHELGEKIQLVADVAFPCETNFLNRCFMAFKERQAFAPYPLLDLSTLLLAKGYDPVGTFERRENELPAHNPLNDARQTARIWFQLVRGETVL